MATHKNLAQSDLHEAKIGTISIGGTMVSLSDVSFARAHLPMMSADTAYTTFTCPAGKKALLMGRTWLFASNGPQPTVTPQGTPGATSYSYYVAPVSNGREAPWSLVGSTNTGNAVLDSTNFNRLTWTAYVGAASYNIYVYTNPGQVALIGNATSTTFDDTGFTRNNFQSNLTVSSPAILYSKFFTGSHGPVWVSTPSASPNPGGTTGWAYKVTAIGVDGLETIGGQEIYTTTGNSVLSPGGSRIDVQWSSNPEAIAYRIYRTFSGGTPSTTGLLATQSASIASPLIFSDYGSAVIGGPPPGVDFYTLTVSQGFINQSHAWGPTVILEEGQSVVQVASQYGISFWREVYLCDASVPISTKWLTSFSAGYNTLYTVPAGKTAFLLPNLSSSANSIPSNLHYHTASGGAQVSFHHVPSGGVAGLGNMINYSNGTIGSNSSWFFGHPGCSLQAGDSIVVKTSSSAMGQAAYLSVAEF